MRAGIAIICLVITQELVAQNLVPNPGFEAFYKCPVNYNSEAKDFYLPGWNSASFGTPDHFHSCSQSICGVPVNWAGVAHPHSGDGYVGIYVWGRNGKSYREYIQCKLIEPLQPGKEYRIGFYFKLSSYSQYKTDRIGMLLLDSALGLKRNKVFRVEPTLSVIQTPLETGEWDEAHMTYRAHGGETHLVIGNFYDDHSTENIRLESRAGKNAAMSTIAYFYVDDVSVIPAELVADSIAHGVKKDSKPNPIFAFNNIQFEFNSDRLVPYYASELDRLVTVLNEKPQWSVELIGHTDDIGPEAYNVDLSRNRASGVSEYLKSKGISSDRISTMAMGETKPLMDNIDEYSRKVNRRVEVQFIQR